MPTLTDWNYLVLTDSIYFYLHGRRSIRNTDRAKLKRDFHQCRKKQSRLTDYPVLLKAVLVTKHYCRYLHHGIIGYQTYYQPEQFSSTLKYLASHIS